MGLSAVLDALACPVCSAEMHLDGGSVLCAVGHRFDVSRSGYVNLLPGGAKPTTADTPEMVAARIAFLGSGHFTPLIDRVVDAVKTGVADVPGLVLDAGGGTGEYLAAALRALPSRRGIVVDLSRTACAGAARISPSAAAVVADVWHGLPIRTGSIAALLDVFAPRNAAEFRRVLDPAGALIVVTPTSEHLSELVSELGLVTVDPDKDERLSAQLAGHFELVSATSVFARIQLTHAELCAAVRMGPSSAHFSAQEIDARVAELPEAFPTALSARVSTYRPVAPAGVT